MKEGEIGDFLNSMNSSISLNSINSTNSTNSQLSSSDYHHTSAPRMFLQERYQTDS